MDIERWLLQQRVDCFVAQLAHYSHWQKQMQIVMLIYGVHYHYSHQYR